MIKEKQVIITGHRLNYDHYKNLNYDIFYRKTCLVNVEDLMPSCSVKITSICDHCHNECLNTFKDYYTYTNGLIDEYFCKKCKKIKFKKTSLEKYGFDNPMKSNQVKENLKKSLVEKYGSDHYSKTTEFKDKFKKTILSKYGVGNPFEYEEFKEKIKKTNIENLGFPYPTQSDEVVSKSKQTNQQKYGSDSYSKTDQYKIQVKKTNQEKYGADSYSKTDDYKKRIKETNMDRYGSQFFSQTELHKNESKSKKESKTKIRYGDLIGERYEILSYSNFVFLIFHKECGKKFTADKDLIYSRLNIDVCICTQCLPVSSTKSSIEIEMCNFLDSKGIFFLSGDRNILNGKELDIYIPDHKLAIEINGIYWHSEKYKDSKYHLSKTLDCQKEGIDLIHVWEDDWKTKQEIIKSIILNKLNMDQNRIFARKCHVGQVDPKTCRIFLDQNHIQGFCNSQIKLGLFHVHDLVSLMTFGFRYTNGKREFELIRFCNKINHRIIGSASKLFKNFLNQNVVDQIISYSDISLFDGGMYEKLGFRKSNLSSPNYFWIVDGRRRHRFNYNKSKLVKEGFDPKKSEVEIMKERGFLRAWGCGQQKWIYP